jgi:prepilin-type N-terminal cleavage/methylation domain-containing protein
MFVDEKASSLKPCHSLNLSSRINSRGTQSKKIKQDFFQGISVCLLDSPRIFEGSKIQGMTRSAQLGFTLVELSIVLVIIGLIVGGVIGGQSLMASAKLNKTITQIQQYQTSFNIFSDKYDAYPGDMANATSYWSDSSNGNGDGKIEHNTQESCTYIWHHLMKAGLISGTYTGQSTGATPYLVPGVNVPKSSIRGDSGFRFYWEQAGIHSVIANFLWLGSTRNGQDWLNGAALYPTEAETIDKKMDDGKSSDGKILGWVGGGATGTCQSGTGYNVTNNNISCKLAYVITK